MITNLDMDDLYDELKVSEFNEKAKTKDGKPLALGNGKIISQPLFTNKNNLYTAGQCTWYAFDKRAQDGHTISTFWEMRKIGLDKHLAQDSKSTILQKRCDSSNNKRSLWPCRLCRACQFRW